MNKNFDIEKALDFIDYTNQRDFDTAMATRNLNYLINSTDPNTQLNPEYIFPHASGDMFLGIVVFSLQEIYFKWLYENDYYLQFSFKEFETTFKIYLRFLTNTLTEEDKEKDLTKNKNINSYALEFIMKNLKLKYPMGQSNS